MSAIDISPWAGLPLFVATVAIMEVIAIYGHKHVMHGWAWFLHKSHHEPRKGWFEKNDWFGVMGAAVAIALFWYGDRAGGGTLFVWLASGITAYGAIYFGFHDIIVHRRIHTGYVPRSRYMKRIVQAHRLHHVIESKEGTVSFGFLWAPPVEALKRELAANIAAGSATLRQSATERMAMTETRLPPAIHVPE